MCCVIIFFVKNFILINCFVFFVLKFKDFEIIVLSLIIKVMIFAFNSLFFVVIILMLRRYKFRDVYKRAIIILRSLIVVLKSRLMIFNF